MSKEEVKKTNKTNATKQAKEKPYNPADNLPKDTQFGGKRANPRHNGAWKKEDTARYKLEQMIKLSDTELDALKEDEDTPTFEKRLAVAIQKGQWKEIEGMMNQVYGKPKEVHEYEVAVDTSKEVAANLQNILNEKPVQNNTKAKGSSKAPSEELL